MAARVLAEWMECGNFPDRKLADIDKDLPFIMELVHGCIRKYGILRWVINQWVHKQPSDLTLAILHIGIYQLMFMENVAVYAAINECVEASKRQPNGMGAAKLVNAILRRFDRESAQVVEALASQPDFIQFSHPEELFQRWIHRYGIKSTHMLATWNNQIPNTIIRLNKEKVEADAFVEALQKMQIEPVLHPQSDKEIFFILPRGVGVPEIPGYQQGWFIVQDPSTIHAVNLLDPKTSEKVLDACASPGGKSVLIAERMQSAAGLTVMELHEDRLPRLEDNLMRMNISKAQIIQGDARYPKQSLKDKLFDAILLDVPCSNSGVLQRRSDARWRINQERLKALNTLQYDILNGCAHYVASGGRMVYSTCSLEYEENEGLIDKWIKKNPDFFLKDSIKILPWEAGSDGSFSALLCRS